MSMLDFSSLDEKSLVHYITIKHNPTNKILLDILSLSRKNCNFLYKDELGTEGRGLCSSYYGASAKQYEIKSYHPDTLFLMPAHTAINFEPTVYQPHPACTDRCSENLTTGDNPVSVLRVKGLKRSLAGKKWKEGDFEQVIERFCQPRTVSQYSIRRRNRKLFVVGEGRRVLSKLNVKQYFHSQYSDRDFFFGFPLYLKSFLE